jgi:hypothetical protein
MVSCGAVDRQGGGVVEFSNKSDQEYAVKKLDDTEFNNRMDRFVFSYAHTHTHAGIIYFS